MTLLGQSAFLKALGWALLNSLWQFSLLWLAFALFINSRKSLSPATKHGFALVMITAGFIWFAAGLSFEYFAYSDATTAQSSGYLLSNDSLYSVLYRTVSHFLDSNLSYLSLIYLLVVATLFVRFFRYFYYSRTIQTSGLHKLRAELRLYVQQLVEQLDIRQKVSVWVSEYIDTPMIIGFLKPTILIPIASINQLSVKQLEAILLHELAHIKRNDYLINLYIATTEILFFFNPFTKMLISSIKQEREKSCDDWVIQFQYDPHQYASALLKLEQCRSDHHSTSLAATGECRKVLLHRVQRIMGLKKTQPQNGFKLLAYFFTIGLLSFIALVNPGDLVIKQLASNLAVVNNFISASSKETGLRILINDKQQTSDNSNTIKTTTKQKAKTKKPAKDSPEPAEDNNTSSGENNLLVSDVSNNPDQLNEITATLSNLVNKENRDFSIPEKEEPVLPAAVSVSEFPFVPNSSFSYFFEDTSKPRIKQENYNEHLARQSMVQAQKAVDKIDWSKLEKDFKKSKVNLDRLRQEIQKSLQELNWQEINQQVKDSLSKETAENVRILHKEYENITNYKIRQKQYQEIKTQLLQQEEKSKRDEEMQIINIQKKLQKKRVVVYI